MRSNPPKPLPKAYRRTLALAALPLIAACLLAGGCTEQPSPPQETYNAELEYLKSLHQATPIADPELVANLMQQFMNANQLAAGIEFFQSLLQKQQAQLTPEQQGVYLSALAVLRASHANQVPLLSRIGWVNDTIAMLEQARTLTHNEAFLVRWMIGVVYAQLPDRFGKTDAALTDLKWCVDNIAKAPQAGWLREIYYRLAVLYDRSKDPKQARAYLQLSGYEGYDKPVTLVTPYAVDADTGFTFHPRRLREIVPGKLFNLSGFEFTEYYFVVSNDGQELIAIDAGTRPDSAQATYEFLRNRVPGLPPLTTVLVTHSHWDHIGGHRYFRSLGQPVKFYARDNYRQELDIVSHGTRGFSYFFGSQFKDDFIADFKPDVTISTPTEINIGGTRFALIPIPGGETNDGMFIHLPEHDTLFVGDFIMPYIGAPFVEEGNLPGLFAAIDVVSQIRPKHLLHGHEALTRIWHSADLLAQLKTHLEWLHQATLKAIWSGASRTAIQQQNLMPPFIHQHPEVHLPYIVMRENVINRLYDQNTGYWQSDLQGMDYLSQEEFGSLLGHYLHLSEPQLAGAIDTMLVSGDHALAARTATWALTQYPNSEKLQQKKTQAFVKLAEKYQEINPFKFIIYSESGRHGTRQLQPVPAKEP